MENSKGDGYISEKIIQSFIAGTIPIYIGDYLIDEYINPKLYIIFYRIIVPKNLFKLYLNKYYSIFKNILYP